MYFCLQKIEIFSMCPIHPAAAPSHSIALNKIIIITMKPVCILTIADLS